MSFIAGLIVGAIVAGAQVALERYGPSFGPFSLSGNGALAAPVILIPLGLFWGWSWISNRWSGRSDLPIVLYTFGMYLGVGLAAPMSALLIQGSDPATLTNTLPTVLLTGLIFVLPAAAIGGVLYWLFKSGKLPTSAATLLIGYLIGLPLAAFVPFGQFIAMGTTAGTAAGHAWRSNSRLFPGILVILVMALIVFGIPYVLRYGLTPPTF